MPAAPPGNFNGNLLPGLDTIAAWHGLLAEQCVDATAKATAAMQNRFSFLGVEQDFGTQIKWHDKTKSQLWRYNLHYFEWLHDLCILAAVDRRGDAFNAAKRQMLDWIPGNKRLAGDGWHPYTVSLRAVNWLVALDYFHREFDNAPDDNAKILDSLTGQLQVLNRTLEFDVRGNHLLKNLKALIWAGCFLQGGQAEKWLAKGIAGLEEEVAEQVLADGGHFERCPGYHLQVWNDLLETGMVLRVKKNIELAWLNAAISRMADFALTVLGPNLYPPLLKDSALDAAPAASDLFAASCLYLGRDDLKIQEVLGLVPYLWFGREGLERYQNLNVAPRQHCSAYLPQSGFMVAADQKGEHHFVFDVGKPCPEYLPAHSHADMLTYELTVGGKRFVVDSGVYEYQEGQWRDYFRSTRAHNTVEVDGANQSDVYSSFRVARRARPLAPSFRVEDGVVIMRGGHDGYARLASPVIHQRTVAYHPEGAWLVVDRLIGQGNCQAESFIHLHPEVALAIQDDGYALARDDTRLSLVFAESSPLRVIENQDEQAGQGWHSEVFGIKRRNTVLALELSGELPVVGAYLLTTAESPHLRSSVDDGKTVLEYVWAGHEHRLVL